MIDQEFLVRALELGRGFRTAALEELTVSPTNVSKVVNAVADLLANDTASDVLVSVQTDSDREGARRMAWKYFAGLSLSSIKPHLDMVRRAVAAGKVRTASDGQWDYGVWMLLDMVDGEVDLRTAEALSELSQSSNAEAASAANQALSGIDRRLLHTDDREAVVALICDAKLNLFGCYLAGSNYLHAGYMLEAVVELDNTRLGAAAARLVEMVEQTQGSELAVVGTIERLNAPLREQFVSAVALATVLRGDGGRKMQRQLTTLDETVRMAAGALLSAQLVEQDLGRLMPYAKAAACLGVAHQDVTQWLIRRIASAEKAVAIEACRTLQGISRNTALIVAIGLVPDLSGSDELRRVRALELLAALPVKGDDTVTTAIVAVLKDASPEARTAAVTALVAHS